MSRFKFRAWYSGDIEKGEPLLFEQKEIDHELFFVCKDAPEIMYPFYIPFMDDDWIVEQWTGLYDKNAVEIYEGDIVTFDPDNLDTYEEQQEAILLDFITDKKLFTIVYNNSLTAFRKSLIFPPEERANHKCETTIHNGDIVVGNIHENGEFLK